MKFEKLREVVDPANAVEVHYTHKGDDKVKSFAKMDNVPEEFDRMKVTGIAKAYPIMIMVNDKEEKRDGLAIYLEKTKKSKKDKPKKKDEFEEAIEDMKSKFEE